MDFILVARGRGGGGKVTIQPIRLENTGYIIYVSVFPRITNCELTEVRD